MRVKSILTYCMGILLVLAVGCGVFNRPETKNGYYVRHYNACGPEAVGKALTKFRKYKKRVSRTKISQDIQDNGNTWRHLASLIDKEGVEITCPSEIAEVCRQYGFIVIPISNLNRLDPLKDVALVLVRKGLLEWHWLCFPADSFITDYYGDDTVISKIYLLKELP